MLSRLAAKGGVSWTDVDQPEAEELAGIIRESDLTPLDAEFVTQNHQRPTVILRDRYIIILIHVPVFDKKTRVTSNAPLYCIATSQQCWTIHYEAINALTKVFKDYEEIPDKCDEYFGSTGLHTTLHLINKMYDGANQKLIRLNKQIDIAADAIFHGNERKMVEEASVLMRDVMDFRRIVRSQRDLFATLPGHALIDEYSRDQWYRLHAQTRKLWDFLESLYESTSELSTTNYHLLQHKENELLRLLTYYSIISIPIIIFIAPISQRLNSGNPAYSIIFFGILGTLIVSLLVIFLRFRKKKVL